MKRWRVAIPAARLPMMRCSPRRSCAWNVSMMLLLRARFLNASFANSPRAIWRTPPVRCSPEASPRHASLPPRRQTIRRQAPRKMAMPLPCCGRCRGKCPATTPRWSLSLIVRHAGRISSCPAMSAQVGLRVSSSMSTVHGLTRRSVPAHAYPARCSPV